jgi:ParB family chromosome partitioning protein
MPELIPITAIGPGPERRLRRLNPDQVQALAQSIREIGLQSPISLRARPTLEAMPYNHNGKLYSVVAGEHRLEACRSLGWQEIPAIIVDLDDLRCQLWEIDENLARAELTELERAEHIRVRKFVYEQIHPETKNGGDHGNQHSGGKKRQNDKLSFCQDTAEKTGLDRRTVERSVHRAEAIAPEVKDAIRDIPEIADKGAELDALAAVAPEEQKAAVEAVRSGQARNVREATRAAKTRQRRRRRAALSDQEIVRREMVAAVERCWKKIAQRLAAIQIDCAGKAIQVGVTFRELSAAAKGERCR